MFMEIAAFVGLLHLLHPEQVLPHGLKERAENGGSMVVIDIPFF